MPASQRAISAFRCAGLGNLLAKAIESLDTQPQDALRATGATPGQVFFLGVWPAVLPQFVSQALYVREFNIRDSTILGLVGAGGLGLLLSEAMSLFQWCRLATLLLAGRAIVLRRGVVVADVVVDAHTPEQLRGLLK